MNTTFLAIGMLGPMEIGAIFLVVLLLFGAKKIPELARGVGKGMGEFKKAKQEFDREIQVGEEEGKKEWDKKVETPEEADHIEESHTDESHDEESEKSDD